MDQPDTDNSSQAAMISKDERKRLRRLEKQQAHEQIARTQTRHKMVKRIALWGVPLALLGWLVWAVVSSPKTPAEDVVSKRGVHWHPTVRITVQGEPVEIPANLGLGGIHADVHTHDTTGQLHVEMSRPVRKSDLRLARFFEIWGKQFTSRCVVDRCSETEGNVTMLVNGQPNSEFENYLMQDKDRIEITYE